MTCALHGDFEGWCDECLAEETGNTFEEIEMEVE